MKRVLSIVVFLTILTTVSSQINCPKAEKYASIASSGGGDIYLYAANYYMAVCDCKQNSNRTQEQAKALEGIIAQAARVYNKLRKLGYNSSNYNTQELPTSVPENVTCLFGSAGSGGANEETTEQKVQRVMGGLQAASATAEEYQGLVDNLNSQVDAMENRPVLETRDAEAAEGRRYRINDEFNEWYHSNPSVDENEPSAEKIEELRELLRERQEERFKREEVLRKLYESSEPVIAEPLSFTPYNDHESSTYMDKSEQIITEKIGYLFGYYHSNAGFGADLDCDCNSYLDKVYAFLKNKFQALLLKNLKESPVIEDFIGLIPNYKKLSDLYKTKTSLLKVFDIALDTENALGDGNAIEPLEEFIDKKTTKAKKDGLNELYPKLGDIVFFEF